MYEKVICTPKNENKAAEIREDYNALMEEGMYERAFACIASEEDREPMHGLRAENAALAFAGHCVNGVGVEKNPERAFRLIRKRVKLSENPALLETYAYFLENGIGCKADPKEAESLLLRARGLENSG